MPIASQARSRSIFTHSLPSWSASIGMRMYIVNPSATMSISPTSGIVNLRLAFSPRTSSNPEPVMTSGSAWPGTSTLAWKATSAPPAASVFRTAVAIREASTPPPQPLSNMAAQSARRIRRMRPISAAASFQQPREPPVLQYSSTRLLLRAVAHDVVLEVDRLDPGAAAGAVLARSPVHLERHRHLVRHRLAHHVLVVRERAAEHLLAGSVERLDLPGVEIGALLERRQPRRPEQLVHPRPADSGDRALIAQKRVEVARLVEEAHHLIEWGRRVGVGAEGGDVVLGRDLLSLQQLGPRPPLRAELAQPQLAAVLEPDQDARRAVAERRA